MFICIRFYQVLRKDNNTTPMATTDQTNTNRDKTLSLIQEVDLDSSLMVLLVIQELTLSQAKHTSLMFFLQAMKNLMF